MKKNLTSALVLFLAALLGIVFTMPVSAMEMGNKRKGKYIYRKVYKACHDRGEVDSVKPVMDPDAHTQAEWEAIFDKREFADFRCKQEWDALSDEELTDIFSYLYSFAADSPTPAKCK